MNNIMRILRQLIAEVNNSLKKTKQDLTPEQQARVRENIGILLGNWEQNDPEAADYIRNRPFYQDESAIHPIDEKFIPDTIMRKHEYLTDDQFAELQGRLNGIN